VSLQLQPGVDDAGVKTDTSPIKRLHILLADKDGDQGELDFEIDRTKQQKLPEVTVEKDKPFTVDVWGCNDGDACERADVTFHGCAAVDLSAQDGGEAVPVVIPIFPEGDPHVDGCPPKLN
jgi:hypothetical protein